MNNLYDFTVPVFVRSLTAMKGFMNKAAEEARTKGTDAELLLNEQLAPDMLPFVRQVQIACDSAKGAAARLSGVELPKFADDETTFAELNERIDATIAFLNTFTQEQFVGAEERMVRIPYLPEGKAMKGLDYAREYSLSNFLFHVTTAYDILRHKGATIGKADFIGGWPQLYDIVA